MQKNITPEGLEKMKKELLFLEKTKRKEVAESLKTAAAFGDLSENSAYEDAKNEQTMLETKIAKLRDTIKSSKVVRRKNGSNLIQLGSKISVKAESGTMDFEIVGETESNPFEGKISGESPLGRAFLGKKEGDVCVIETPSGSVNYKIMKISE